MAIYTRYGSQVEVRYACDDYEASGYVHAFCVEPGRQDEPAYVLIPCDLIADGGIAELWAACENLPRANCTGQHSR